MKKNKQIAKILKHTLDNKLTIHPFGLTYYAESVTKTGHCPCDPIRVECPCDQAKSEIDEKGHCLCGLFWKDLNTFCKEKGWEDEMQALSKVPS